MQKCEKSKEKLKIKSEKQTCCKISTKRGLTGGVPPFLQRTKGLFILEFLDLISLCKSPTSLRVVGAGFARSYRLYEGNRFVFAAANKVYCTFYSCTGNASKLV